MGLEIRRQHVYLVNFNPRLGTKPGKLRPALVLQTDLLNKVEHPSTIVLPFTTKINPKGGELRFFLPEKRAGNETRSDILMDQIIAIDNASFVKELGRLPDEDFQEVLRRLNIILEISTAPTEISTPVDEEES